ncbi:AtpZ/AtpI family protein [Nocardioides donggukensis]|uniref:AtpZ/AtpI family protein n=1 Tax=Nocardioides donggukensis TaxID=2774019 RepID=A0A927K3S7_9ACTN|nr:AtpZ/AtpI family protein [Nocardioides donggukensis]MBD8870102.1 AtpZ/AtpI family protein [Nocardioides donggukensis]
MAQQKPPSARPGGTSDDTPRGDPWHAFGYLVSGVAMYGLLGWALDQWWDTSFLVVVGILLGAGLGIYMTWARFNRQVAPPQDETLSG